MSVGSVLVVFFSFYTFLTADILTSMALLMAVELKVGAALWFNDLYSLEKENYLETVLIINSLFNEIV